MPFVIHSDAADGGNGAATDCHDFIDNKLIPFATSSTHFPDPDDRWTLEREDVVVVDEESEFFLTPPVNAPDAPVIAFHTRDDAVYIFGGTGYSGSVESYALPGNTRQYPDEIGSSPDWDPDSDSDRKRCSWSNAWPTAGLSGHWLFAPDDGSYIYAVIEIGTRRFRHIMFGQYDKFQAAMDGGEFFGAEFWNQAIADIDEPYGANKPHSSAIIGSGSSLGDGRQCGVFRALDLRTGAPIAPAAEWHFNNGNDFWPDDGIVRPSGAGWDTANNTAADIGQSACNTLGRGSPGASYLFQVQQSVLANVKALLPLTIWCVGFADSQDRWMPVGKMPDVFRLNMNGFTDGQDFIIGSDTYSLFPCVNSDQVNTLANEEYSGFDGFAILQRP